MTLHVTLQCHLSSCLSVHKGYIKWYPHCRQIGICPELTGWIVIHTFQWQIHLLNLGWKWASNVWGSFVTCSPCSSALTASSFGIQQTTQFPSPQWMMWGFLVWSWTKKYWLNEYHWKYFCTIGGWFTKHSGWSNEEYPSKLHRVRVNLEIRGAGGSCFIQICTNWNWPLS